MRVALQTAMEFIMPFKCRLLRKPIDVCRTRMRGRYIYRVHGGENRLVSKIYTYTRL